MRHLLSIADVDPGGVGRLVSRAVSLSEGAAPGSLAGRSVGTWFELSSTRTRTSFMVAAQRLGAHLVAYGAYDLQVRTGESLADSGRALSHFLRVLVVRTPRASDAIRALAAQPTMSVISGMTADEHPVQALTDLATLARRCGSLADVHLLYVGEGNSTAASLALAVASIPGPRLTLLTPPGYGLGISIRERLGGRPFAAAVQERHDMGSAPRGVDAIYTARWVTTGTEKPDPEWRGAFGPFRVTAELMSRCARPGRVPLFMHDLPAVRGDEVDVDVIDGPTSIAFEQAGMKLFAAMAVLEWCDGADDGDR